MHAVVHDDVIVGRPRQRVGGIRSRFEFQRSVVVSTCTSRIESPTIGMPQIAAAE